MRIGISTVGSRGDVQPALALAAALCKRRHTVRIATHERYRSLVLSSGAELFATGHGFASEDVWSGEEGKHLFETHDPTLYALRFFRRVKGSLARHMKEVRSAFQDMDVVAGLQTVEMVSHAVATSLEKPYVALHVNPPDPRFFYGSFASRIVPRLADLAARVTGQREAFEQAKHEALGDLRGHAQPLRLDLLGLSSSVLATPLDWGDDIVRTGFWFFDDPSPPNVPLMEFLAAGPPPIAVGFGSMPGNDARDATNAFLKAAKSLGQRVIFLSGAASLGASAEDPSADRASSGANLKDKNVHVARDVPHHWLLPKVAAFVHHGGAGTTAAAMRAGIPQVVVPHFGDQFFWARLVSELGLGTELARHRLTEASAMTEALGSLLACGERATLVANAIDGDNGADRAAFEIEKWSSKIVKKDGHTS
ncbi:MAG: glycosyltransferase family 1 protein [Polyangiaceae bacterium]|nr:glycosyltransferase family 1 protein [Polyangiaceae bacterium]